MTMITGIEVSRDGMVFGLLWIYRYREDKWRVNLYASDKGRNNAVAAFKRDNSQLPLLSFNIPLKSLLKTANVIPIIPTEREQVKDYDAIIQSIFQPNIKPRDSQKDFKSVGNN